MAITITAVEQLDRRVAVTVAGLSTAVPAVDSLILYRDDLDQPRAVVRGFLDYVPTADGFVAFDNEAPLERPVFYTLATTRSDGTVVEQTTAAPIMLSAAYPVVSEPVSGDGVDLSAIVTWPDLEREGRATVIDVVDRPDPIVVSSGLSSPSSAPVLRVDTIVARRALRTLLESAQVLQIRDPHPDVEDAYVAVGKVTERRLTNDPTDPRRAVLLEVRHVSAPAIGIASGGDTLDELNDAIPGTLNDIAAAFPGTLLDIAAADLAAL